MTDSSSQGFAGCMDLVNLLLLSHFGADPEVNQRFTPRFVSNATWLWICSRFQLRTLKPDAINMHRDTVKHYILVQKQLQSH